MTIPKNGKGTRCGHSQKVYVEHESSPQSWIKKLLDGRGIDTVETEGNVYDQGV